MRKIWAVIFREYKMQTARPAGWAVLLGATLLAQADNFPSVGNLRRLEFLNQPAYFVSRIMNFDALVLLFGLLFLLAGRIPLDRRTGMKTLFMASPLKKGQYLAGKLLGGFFSTFTFLTVFLCLNTTVYCIAAPFAVSLEDGLVPLLKALVFPGFFSCLFVSFCAVALPGIMDLRFFYILAAVLFGANAVYVGSADAMPFYLITSGELARLIWVHPKWPFVDAGSVWANGIFLTAGGLVSGALPLLARKFWRAE